MMPDDERQRWLVLLDAMDNAIGQLTSQRYRIWSEYMASEARWRSSAHDHYRRMAEESRGER